MFHKLLKRYLKSFENPLLKAVTTTFTSFLLCTLPFLLIIIGECILHLIKGWLSLPDFDCPFIEWCLKSLEWIIENLTLLSMPVAILLVGAFILRSYTKRHSITVMLAIYLFKRMTEPLLGVNFAAWLVNYLSSSEKFEFLEHLIIDKNLQTFGSGQMVIVTLTMWLILTLALYIQIYKIRQENSASGLLAILEKTRLKLLSWIDSRQNNR